MRIALACLSLVALCLLSPLARAQTCPNVMLVVQGSTTMNADIQGGGMQPTRWELVTTNLPLAIKQQPKLRYGLEIFAAMGAGNACYRDTAINVPVGPNTAKMVLDAVKAHVPNGITNPGDAIRRAYTDGKLDEVKRPNYIVLITAGNANCAANEPAATLAEITAAAALMPPVRTIVLAVAPAGSPGLNMWAKAGKAPRNGGACGGANQPDCYYHADDPKDFLAAFEATHPKGSPCGCEDGCLGNPCPAGTRCEIAMPGADGACRPDPCEGMQCGGDYCRNGKCVAPCPPCAAGERCEDGRCVADECAGVSCPMDKVCVAGGSCVTDRCAQSPICCTPPSLCDPASGACAGDPCAFITCPTDTRCVGGWCEQYRTGNDFGAGIDDLGAPVDLAGETAPQPDLVATNVLPPLGQCDGCCCTLDARPATDTPLLALLAVVVVSAGMARRRRPRRHG